MVQEPLGLLKLVGLHLPLREGLDLLREFVFLVLGEELARALDALEDLRLGWAYLALHYVVNYNRIASYHGATGRRKRVNQGYSLRITVRLTKLPSILKRKGHFASKYDKLDANT